MNPATETFLRVEALFNEAQDAPVEARAALIDERAHGDRALAAEVWSLLKACDESERVTASRIQDGARPQERTVAERRIGVYRIDRLLGRGGMGAVYLAHRADGQFEQDVAIKLIDLPLATDLFRERFRQERQILAGLQHPYIARLLDGGVTENGDPYLVMEYVDGVPIHRFCDARNLSTPERVALFLRVCEAVQFAHQNLVVHRDLKPDNILVAEDATPRLLDFGTAKLLSPEVGNAGSEFTREGYQSFTPQYASPEQVLGYPITTASDTYSLAVLLYLLMTGALPYELKQVTTAEMVRVVCEEPPRRPSEAMKAGKKLDADLDAILMKGLRKEPQERYLTAEQLAQDVRAWLEGQPVGARRGTVRYRAQKFVQRHKLGLAGVALLLLTLLAGVAGVLWQARRANLERRKAEARSADLRQLSNSLLSELDEAIKDLPGSTGAQKLLVTRVLEHLDRMALDAQNDRQTRLDLVDAYTRLGDLQGNPYDQNLGDPSGALASLDKAIALAKPLGPAGSTDSEALQALALAQESRSEVLFGAARTQEAVASMRESVATFARVIAFPHATTAQFVAAAAVYGGLGDELGQSGTSSLADPAAALDAYRKALDLDFRIITMDPNMMRARRGVSIMEMKIGSVEMKSDPAAALKDFQEALQRAEALPKGEQGALTTMRMHAMLQRKEADAMTELGEYEQAEALFTEVRAAQQKLADADAQDLRAHADLEVVLVDAALGEEAAADPEFGALPPAVRSAALPKAEQLWTQVVAVTEKMVKQDATNDNWRLVLADAEVHLASVRTRLRVGGDQTALASKSLATIKDLAKAEGASVMVLDQAANDFLLVEPESLRDPQFSAACAERAATLSHRREPDLLLTLARADSAAGKRDQARAVANEALALLPTFAPGSAEGNLRKRLEMLAQ